MTYLIFLVAFVLIVVWAYILKMTEEEGVKFESERLEKLNNEYQYKTVLWHLNHDTISKLLINNKAFKNLMAEVKTTMKLKDETINKKYVEVFLFSVIMSSVEMFILAIQKKWAISLVVFFASYCLWNIIMYVYEKSKITKYRKIMSNESIPIIQQYAIYYPNKKNPIDVLEIIIAKNKNKEIARQLEQMIKYINSQTLSLKEAVGEYKLTLKNSPGFEMLCSTIQISMETNEDLNERITEYCKNLTELTALEKRGKIKKSVSLISLILILFGFFPGTILMIAPTFFGENGDGKSLYQTLNENTNTKK